MAHKTADFVEQVHTGFTGLGEYTDAGGTVPTDCRSIASQLTTGDSAYFTARGEDGSGNGAQGIEVFLGTKTATGLARTTLIASTTGSFINWSTASAVRVSLTAPASRILQLDNELAYSMPAISAEPSVPLPDWLKFYAKKIAGKMLPKIIGPSGIDTVMQVGLHGNSVFMVGPASGTTAPTVWGGTLTTAATMSLQQTIASANPWQATARKRFQTSTTAGNQSGMRTAYTQWFRGSASGYGGFFFRTQFGGQINLNGGQKFMGLCASTGVLANTASAVSALVNMIGMGYDSADASSGNWFLMRNDGTGVATKVDLGATNAARANTTHGYDLIIFCPPGAATEIFVRIVNLHNNAVVLDTSYTTDLPAVNTGLAFKAEVTNVAQAAADNIEVAKVYIESDY